MTKYATLGGFFTILVFFFGVLMVNHQSNTNSMKEINMGLEAALVGEMRDTDGDSGGLRAQDLVSEITKEIAVRQADLEGNGRVLSVSYKLFDEDETVIPFDTAVNSNSIVYSIQYKVDIYKQSSLEEDGKTVKAGVTPESSTENRIALYKKD